MREKLVNCAPWQKDVLFHTEESHAVFARKIIFGFSFKLKNLKQNTTSEEEKNHTLHMSLAFSMTC